VRHSPAVGTQNNARHYLPAMTKYRFVTPHRKGKWYPDLQQAQRFASAIGAGFLDRLSGRFVAYRHASLEVAEFPDQPT